jgi:hypothetical protein
MSRQIEERSFNVNGGVRDPRIAGVLEEIAITLERRLNPPFGVRQIGFLVMTFPFHDPDGRTAFITNMAAEDISALLLAQLDEFDHAPAQ